jgi:hypothetical protein
VQAIGTPPTMVRTATTRRNRKLGLARTEVSTMGSHSHCNFPEGNRAYPVGLALGSWCVAAVRVRLLGASAHQAGRLVCPRVEPRRPLLTSYTKERTGIVEHAFFTEKIDPIAPDLHLPP